MTEEKHDPIAVFLANGGVIQQVAYRASGRVEGAPTNAWGSGKKAGRPAAKDKTDEDHEEDIDE